MQWMYLKAQEKQVFKFRTVIMQATVSIVFFTQKPLWNLKKKKAQLMSASDGSKNSLMKVTEAEEKEKRNPS